jgi:hypothetical protein
MSIARLLAATITAAALATPIAAFAQQAPPAAGASAPDPGPPPSYARPTTVNGEESIQGRVASFDGKYNLQINDDRGYIDSVEMRQGTIINPTGIRLAPGMRVTVLGHNRGHYFAAEQIDTPYQSYGFDYPAYPGYGVYPGYGYGVYPGYPAFSVGIGFGPVFYHHWH